MNEKIIKNISIAKDYIEKTKKLHNPNKKEFLNNEATYLSVSMSIFTILNTFIEIGEELIDEEGFQIAMSYKEIFIILKNENIIPEELKDFLIEAIKNRNMIAHQYGVLDKENIYEIAQNVKKLEEFIEKITQFYIR